MRWGWTSGLGGVGGRGRASTHGALQILGSEPDKKTDFEFFWGREGRHARSVFVGWRLQIVGSEPDKKNDFEFFWGRGEGGPWSGEG